jgi:3',5'-cyclic AMP phosphodiesterase CpdA
MLVVHCSSSAQTLELRRTCAYKARSGRSFLGRILIVMYPVLPRQFQSLFILILTACESADGADGPKPNDFSAELDAGQAGGSNAHDADPRHTTKFSTDQELKVAFIGDQGINTQARKVLQLVVDEQADAAFLLGDLAYGDGTPADWAAQLHDVLGDDFPYFAVIGNHDVNDWFGEGGFAAIVNERLSRIPDAHCEGEYGIKANCVYRGLGFVTSGVGTYGSDHEAYLESALQSSNAVFRLCLWHKNQHDMQLGTKADEVGWDAYRICAHHGAPVLNGHEHSYSRTQPLTAIGEREQMHGATSEMSDFKLGPGRTFVAVSGLGGKGRRDRAPDHEQDGWWASTYAQNDQRTNNVLMGTDPEIEDGALFVTFHVDNDAYKARAYFKTVDGQVRDELTWRASNQE